MKALILYHPASESSRIVEDFSNNLKVRTGREVELVSLETKEGSLKAQIYGVVDYPAIIIISDDGRAMKIWEGAQLPASDEVVSNLIS